MMKKWVSLVFLTVALLLSGCGSDSRVAVVTPVGGGSPVLATETPTPMATQTPWVVNATPAATNTAVPKAPQPTQTAMMVVATIPPTATPEATLPPPPSEEICGQAVRVGDADGTVWVVPPGATYTVENDQWGGRFMVFPEGKTISGLKGAVWSYDCSAKKVMQLESGNNPLLVE